MSPNTTETLAVLSHETIPPAVTGWLLFLCLILTLMYPATTLYHILAHTVPSLLKSFNPAHTVLLSVYSIVFTAVAVLSFIAGLKLWLVKRNAVRFARRWLWTYLIANIAYFVFWVIVAKPHQSLSLAEMGWYHVAGPIPSFALWYFYLEHSKRVRATYSPG
jgi:Protein of unknown function (DUF2569)